MICVRKKARKRENEVPVEMWKVVLVVAVVVVLDG